MGGHGVAGREAVVDRLVLAGLGGQEPLQGHPKAGLSFGQRHAVLRALRPGDARHYAREIEFHLLGEGRLLGVLVVPEPLLAGIGLDELDQLLRAP